MLYWWFTDNSRLPPTTVRLCKFLAHLAKGHVSFCHHLASVPCASSFFLTSYNWEAHLGYWSQVLLYWWFSDNYTPAPQRGRGVYCFTSVRPSKIFFVAFLSATIDGRNLIFGHKLHIGTPYRGKRFWTHQIPTSCLPTLLIFIHIEHICSFFVAFFSATIDGRNLIFGHKLHIDTPYRGKWFWTHQIPTSCLPKSGGIISEH
jgi:hypothetical protein